MMLKSCIVMLLSIYEPERHAKPPGKQQPITLMPAVSAYLAQRGSLRQPFFAAEHSASTSLKIA